MPTPSNPYYLRAFNPLPTSGNRSRPLTGEFDALKVAFDVVWADFNPYQTEVAAARQGQASLLANLQRYVSTASPAPGNVDMGLNRVINLGNPVQPNDGARLADVQAARDYAQSLAMQSALPANLSQIGMVARVGPAGLPGYADWWGAATTLTVADSNFQLIARATYRLNSAGGSFNLLLPPNPSDGDWVMLVDVTGALLTNKVVLKPGTKKLRNVLEDMDLDVQFDVVLVVYEAATSNWIEYE